MIDDETCNWALREILWGEPSLGDISGEARTTFFENSMKAIRLYIHRNLRDRVCSQLHVGAGYARQNGFTAT